MSSKRFKEFKPMTQAQLKDKMADIRMELIKSNAQVATGTTPKSPGMIRQAKRNIARIKTILNSKTQGGEDKKL
jgi:large subunit ribosomal protein L29